MKKKRTCTINNFFGLDYLSIENVPVYDSEFGDIVDMKHTDLENLAIKALIKGKAPLKGKEIKLFRKLLGYSLEKFASEIGLTSGSILKWEKAMDERLHPINEVAVRAYLAEKFDVNLPGKYSELLGSNNKHHPVVARVS